MIAIFDKTQLGRRIEPKYLATDEKNHVSIVKWEEVKALEKQIEPSVEKVETIYATNPQKNEIGIYTYNRTEEEIAEIEKQIEEEKKEQEKWEEEQANRPPYIPPRQASLSNIMQDTEKIDSKADNISSNQLAQLLGTTGLYEDMNQSDLAIMMGLSEIYEVVNKEE